MRWPRFGRMKVKGTSLISFVWPLRPSITAKRWQQELVDELTKLTIERSLGSSQKSKLSFRHTDNLDSWQDLVQFWKAPTGSMRQYRFLRMDFSTTVDEKQFMNLISTRKTPQGTITEKHKVPLHQAKQYAIDTVLFDIRRLVNDIALACELAKPSALQATGHTIILKSPKSSKSHDAWVGAPSFWHFGIEESSWPSLTSLSVKAAFGWLEQIPGFNSGLLKGSTGHAVAALTRADESGMGIVWSVMGLEALYCDGNQNLGFQLQSKSTALLGEPAEYKKRVAQMYEYRSRVVHGSVDIPISYDEADAHEEYERYMDKDMESRDFALRLLLATIQRMIKDGGHVLNSRFSCEVASTIKD